MIKNLVEYRNADISRVTANGHAGYAKYGKDVVCSAVSAIIQTALIAIIDISDAPVRYEKSDDGFLRFEVPEPKSEEERIKQQAVLRAMVLGVSDVEKGYKPYVKMEVNRQCL